MSETRIAVPDCLLNGTICLKGRYLGSSISCDVSFMPKDFCSADDVRSLFACDNAMTVSDLLRRIFNYSKDEQLSCLDCVTDSSQWKVYDVRSEKGSPDVLKMFNSNFRVLDIQAYILEDQHLMISMRPEHTRKYAIIRPGDVTREYLVESIHRSSSEHTRFHYDEMQEEISRQHIYNTDIAHNGKEESTTAQLARDKRKMEHLKLKYEKSLSVQYRHMQLER